MQHKIYTARNSSSVVKQLLVSEIKKNGKQHQLKSHNLN